MSRKLPLSALWESQDAEWGIYQDWQIPLKFGDVAKEYQAAINKVGLYDRSYCGKIRVTGRDRISFLNNVLTNDIQKLSPGQGCPSALLLHTGKVLMLMDVYLFEDHMLLIVEAGFEEKTIKLLDKYIIADDVSLDDVTENFAYLRLIGANAPSFLLRLAKSNSLPRAKYDHNAFIINEIEISVISHPLHDIPCFELLVSVAQAAHLADLFLSRKENPISPIGENVMETIRIENGISRYGIDIDEAVTLSETGLDSSFASETKGCYPGQEVVARTKTYSGLQRKWVGFILEGNALPEKGSKVYSEDKEMGWITSAAFSEKLNQGLALGYVTRNYFDCREILEIKTENSKIKARLSVLPFPHI